MGKRMGGLMLEGEAEAALVCVGCGLAFGRFWSLCSENETVLRSIRRRRWQRVMAFEWTSSSSVMGGSIVACLAQSMPHQGDHSWWPTTVPQRKCGANHPLCARKAKEKIESRSTL
jgi:hypothetical protein